MPSPTGADVRRVTPEEPLPWLETLTTTWRHAAATGGLARAFEEHRPGALADADALLRTLEQPRCMTFF